MNANNVVSLNAATGATLAGKEGALVKMTSSGIDVAGASDTVIGTLVRAPLVGTTNGACAVMLRLPGLHYVKIGNNTAVEVGDTLAQYADGGVIKTTSAGIAVAIEAAPGSSLGGQIRAAFL